MDRETDLEHLYEILDRLEAEHGGKRRLKNCDGYMDWPDRGVYFFFAPDETRESTDHLRLTRIGTHAVSAGSQTSLWNRLRTHRGATRGSYEGGGNHRGSVFRKRVGEALIERDDRYDEFPEWGSGNTAKRELRKAELEMERHVSEFIRDLPFLWIEIDDEPGPDSHRAYVERNAIALVSNYQKESIDPRADDWLGKESPVDEIRESGLWNINHVGESYDPEFLNFLKNRLDGLLSDEEPEIHSNPKQRKIQESYSDRDVSSSVSQESGNENRDFENAWIAILQYAESQSYVATLSHGNENEIRQGEDAVEVRNVKTDEWREIPREDFRFAYEILQEEGTLTLDNIEPDLAGRKSMVSAILARALDLEYDSRPLTVYLS